ncbi:MAG: sigma 54-interacting transcriptional regulator [Acidobacteriaceae bacterium]
MQAAHFIDERPRTAALYRPDYRPDWNFGPMAGRSPAMQQLFSQMRHTARHLRVAAIEGESGTGKMLAARALHELGLNPPAPFVPCPAAQFLDARNLTAAGSPAAAGSEFSSVPALKQACGGTLALTRVDELSAAQQARLLEFLQWIDYQHIQLALGSIPRQILCLSGRSLRRLASSGVLRADLASRLTTIRFALPPLRERREDIPLLAELFARQFSAMHGKPIRGLGPQTLPRLVQHSWPGNVRELESAIHAAALSCQGQWIRPIDLPALKVAPVASAAQPAPRASVPDEDPNLDRAILRHIQWVLARVEGNKLRAAKMLGISRSTLYRLLDSASAPSPS